MLALKSTIIPSLLLLSAVAKVPNAATAAEPRVPEIDEQFSMHSLEVDDSETDANLSFGRVIVLEQILTVDPAVKRSRMVANGSLVSGYMQQIVRCDGKMATEDGYFLDIEGGSIATAQCVNASRQCTAFSKFWDFPSNITFLGGNHSLPSSTVTRRIKSTSQGYSKFEYWMDNERYELYTNTSESKTSNANDVPVWMGKVSVADPAHHLWHFEYSDFRAGPAPDSAFAAPIGIQCRPVQTPTESSAAARRDEESTTGLARPRKL